MTTLFLIFIVIVIVTCIWLNDISSRIGVPTLLAFIVLGIVFGNTGSNPMHLDDHAFAKDVCTIALIFIMFYGGFGTRWDAVKPGGKNSGRSIREYSGDGLILLVKRGDEEFIPSGDTVLEGGDVLVILCIQKNEEAIA